MLRSPDMISLSHQNETPPQLALDRAAIFLDFDGTLSALEPDPGDARITYGMLEILSYLRKSTGDAVAIVSGRSIEQLDALLDPLRLPLAGVHGIEIRDHSGKLTRSAVDGKLLRSLASTVSGFSARHSGTLVEVKPGSIALHYRKRPDLEAVCLNLAATLADADHRVKVLTGKMVVEMTLSARNKGDAIKTFLNTPSFAGRVPFFAGDDETDETGFAVVNALGGISVKVGPGETAAHYRLEEVAAVGTYLRSLLPQDPAEHMPVKAGWARTSTLSQDTS